VGFEPTEILRPQRFSRLTAMLHRVAGTCIHSEKRTNRALVLRHPQADRELTRGRASGRLRGEEVRHLEPAAVIPGHGSAAPCVAA